VWFVVWRMRKLHLFYELTSNTANHRRRSTNLIVAVARDKIDLGGLSVWPCAGVHSTATADRHVQQRAHNHSDTVVN
jgi:hypothetical protein